MQIDLNQINLKRRENNIKEIEQIEAINFGKTFNENYLNIKISERYPFSEYDVDFSLSEEFDPWKRANYHMEVLKQFEKSLVKVKFDHWLDQTHICDCLKWMNRAYQMLKIGGTIQILVIDFMDLFNVMRNASDKDIEPLERKIFVESDATGMYYNRTVWTDRRFIYYLKLSFFSNPLISREYSEEYKCNVINVQAIKKVDIKTELKPDGTLKPV